MGVLRNLSLLSKKVKPEAFSWISQSRVNIDSKETGIPVGLRWSFHILWGHRCQIFLLQGLGPLQRVASRLPCFLPLPAQVHRGGQRPEQPAALQT